MSNNTKEHFAANFSETDRNRSICRTCLRIIHLDKASFYHINSTSSRDSSCSVPIKQKFAVCIPEVALEITDDAQICGFCAASLHWAYEFRKNCLKTEETIYNYLNKVGGDIYKVELEELLKWINLKTLKRLESVEIMSADTDWNTGKDSYKNSSVHGIQNEIGIKEEHLFDENLKLEDFAGENSGLSCTISNCSINTEEIQVKEEPIFINVAKLNEEEPITVHCNRHEICATNHTENLHICKVCQMSFTLKCDLRLHMIIHANSTEPYECDVCEFVSPNKIMLRRHLLVSHTKELEFKCKECKSKINDIDDHDPEICLKYKMYSVNTAKKARLQGSDIDWEPYKCDSCDYRCAFKSILLTHKKLHDSDVYYTCNICHESFKEKVDLVRHLNTHSPVGASSTIKI